MGSLFSPRPEKQVFELIDRRDLAALQKLVDRKRSALQAQHPTHGGTPLHVAAHTGWEQGARVLLEAGASPNIPDRAYGALPLHVALSKQNLGVAMRLIEAGSNRQHRHKNGYTPLMVALEKQHVECVEALLRAGINPVEGAREIPIISWACIRWEVMPEERRQDAATAMTRRLLEYGCDVDAPTSEGWTALMFAATMGHYGVVRELLEAGADRERRNEKGERAVDLGRRSLQAAREAGQSEAIPSLERTLALLS